MTTPTIVVPLDATDCALAALPVAKQLAQLQAATLHLVHVASEIAPPVEVLEKVGLKSEDLRGSVLNAKSGDVPYEIVQTASDLDARFIVMCAHTVAGADKTVGRTALSVLKAASCPVVLVRPERGIVPWTLNRVLLPHDGTPTTSAAIRPASVLTRESGAQFVVLHVTGYGTRPPKEHGSLMPPRYLDQPQHEWPNWMREFVERLGSVSSLEALNVRMCLAHGAPAEAVLRFALEHASDLIVLAWRGDWEEPRAATLKEVIRHASAPVMIVRVTP